MIWEEHKNDDDHGYKNVADDALAASRHKKRTLSLTIRTDNTDGDLISDSQTN